MNTAKAVTAGSLAGVLAYFSDTVQWGLSFTTMPEGVAATTAAGIIAALVWAATYWMPNRTKTPA